MDTIATLAADLRAGRIKPLPRTGPTIATYTDAEREALIADMQDTHRPNAKALAGSSFWA